MSYIVLARKWRPKRFAEMVGQEHVLRALGNALDSGKVHHAFLFTGTRGVGKTTVARILAKSLNCETAGVSSNPCGVCAACREIDEGRFVDLIEVDAASRTKVDDTRELLDNVQYAPTRGRYKVYLIDEVHMLSNHSFNALLKTLEEPPPHVKFLLATTDPQKLPVTVLSRCLQFSLKRLPAALIGERLKFIAGGGESAVRTGGRGAAGARGRRQHARCLELVGSADRLRRRRGERGKRARHARHHRSRPCGPAHRGVVARRRRRRCWLRCRSSIAMRPTMIARWLNWRHFCSASPSCRSCPKRRRRTRNSIRESLARLAQAISPEDVQLYYQIAWAAAAIWPWRPSRASGFEMTLLRMLAFRPDAAERRRPGAVPHRRRGAGGRAGARRRLPRRASPARASTSIDASNWPAVVEAANLSGMVRQLALNCVPAAFEQRSC